MTSKSAKPRTIDNVNYTMVGCTLRVLSIDEKIKKGDFTRPLVESPMMSQDGGWDQTWKDDAWRGPKWHRVEDDMRAWIGRTYRDCMKSYFGEDYGRYPIEKMIHDEIVRVIE